MKKFKIQSPYWNEIGVQVGDIIGTEVNEYYKNTLEVEGGFAKVKILSIDNVIISTETEVIGTCEEVEEPKMIKYMEINEFRQIGLLQEINRQFLHPRGLALEIRFDDGGNASLGGIWDYRDDPEGIVYEGVALSQEKADNVQKMIIDKNTFRLRKFGYVIQPIV